MSLIIIFSGPSYVGKSVLINELVKKIPHSCKIISDTTRSKKPLEKSFNHNHISEQEFRNNNYLYIAKKNDFLYGYKKEDFKDNTKNVKFIQLSQDYSVIKKIKQDFKNVVSFFIYAKEDVLKQRALISETDQLKRKHLLNIGLKQTKELPNYKDLFDYSIDNSNTIEQGVNKIYNMILKHL